MTGISTHHRQRSLELITHIGLIMSSAKSLDTMLLATVNLLKTALDVERCSIMILDPNDKVLKLRAASNIPEEEWVKIRVPLGEQVCGKVAETGRAILVEDLVSSDEPVEYAHPERYSTSSYISAPLIVKNVVVGVINVNNRSDAQRFTSVDLQLVTGLASFVALAIDNNRLFAQSENHRAHLENILESLPQGVITMGLNMRASLCNQRLLRLLGITDMVTCEGRRVSEILSHTLYDAVESMKREVIDFAVELHREVEAELPTLGWVPLEISLAPLTDQNGKVDGLLATVMDVSVRREVTELRRLDQLKSNFLSMVSHELRTPLTSIKGSVHLLSNPSSNPAPETVVSMAKIIECNTERLIRLVNNLLDMVNVEQENLVLHRTPVDLGAVASSCVDEFSRSAAEKNISISCECISMKVLADEDRLRQALCHLVENAVKFSGRNSRVDVTASPSGSMAVISVSDNGIGIPDDSQQIIFSRFYQVQDPMTRSAGGTGIGLFQARNIIEMHGGSITVESQLKQGSTFRVELPLLD